MKLLAKFNPEESLEDHIKNCLNVFKEIYLLKENLIKNICQRYKVEIEDFIINCFFIVSFHDFGKGTEDFQRKKRTFPHPLASLPFVNVNTMPITFETLTGEKRINLGTLCVASHHTLLHRDLYLEWQNRMPVYYKDELEDLLNRLYIFYFDVFGKKPSRRIVSPDLDNLIPYDVLSENLRISESEKERIRDLFLLQKGILNYCDWVASGHDVSFEHILKFDEDLLKNKLERKLNKRIGWQNFQRDALNTRGNCLIRIPCGEGKTEASLLWAKNNLEGRRKIVYLLPTRVSTNKMWDRMKKFFGENDVGISHAYAPYILLKDEEKDKQLESEEEDYSLLKHKTFITPMVVSTVDQLLYCMFNHGRWDISLSNIYNSAIIFDEIHTYDFYTLGLIVRTIEMLKAYDVKFCFMSATFPKFLEERLKEVLGENIKTIEDDEQFGNNIKVKINQRNGYLTGVINEIIKNFKSKRKVLVICNTVKQSKDIYLAIKEKLNEEDKDRIMLYHSQFVVKDREEKEEKLEEISNYKVGFIAVTTQVVEVSLDLDFDVLFTEIAPIDALVQRIGRVNRRGKKGICNVFVFEYDESQIRGKDGRWYYPYTKETLDLSWELLDKKVKTKNGALTYLDYKDLVDELYQQIEEKDWRSKFDEGKKIISEILDCLDWIYRCNLEETGIEAKTRDSPIIYVETIPYQFEDEIIRRIHEKKGRSSFSKMIIPYLVRVPLYKVKGRVHLNSQIRGHMFLEVGYDDKIGVHFDYDHKDNII